MAHIFLIKIKFHSTFLIFLKHWLKKYNFFHTKIDLWNLTDTVIISIYKKVWKKQTGTKKTDQSIQTKHFINSTHQSTHNPRLKVNNRSKLIFAKYETSQYRRNMASFGRKTAGSNTLCTRVVIKHQHHPTCAEFAWCATVCANNVCVLSCNAARGIAGKW